MFKTFTKSLGRDAGWWILSRLLSSLEGDKPLETHRRRADSLGRLALNLIRPRRRIILSNLRSVFPDWNPEQYDRIASESVRNISKGFVDLFYYVNHPDTLPAQVVLDDNGVLDELLDGGRGCIVVTGHIGLFPVLGIPMVRRGLEFAPVARDPHDLRLKKVFDDSRTLLGYTNIPDHPPTTVLKKSLRILRGGGVVNFNFDIWPGEKAIDVEFLGRRTPTHSAAVRIAATTGLPIVPGHVLRVGDHHRVTYSPPIEVPEEALDETSPVAGQILQQLATWLSGVIVENPEQYWWIHRRWR